MNDASGGTQKPEQATGARQRADQPAADANVADGPEPFEHCRHVNGGLLGRIELQRTYQIALLGLTMSKSFSQGDLETVARELTQVLVESLRLTAAAVWLYEADRGLFRCCDRYDLVLQEHRPAGSPLVTDLDHGLRNHLLKGRLIVSNDADSEPFAHFLQDVARTAPVERSLLIAPIHLADHLYGFVCCEAAPPRDWQREEKFFTAQVAGLVPVAIESEARRRAEATSRRQAVELARRVEELYNLNQRLERAAEQMFRVEKMATIGLLAEGIVHEVNNSLGFMNTNLLRLGEYVDTLLRHTSESTVAVGSGEAVPDLDYIREDCGAVLEETHQGLQRIIQTIGDLREFAHPGESGVQRMDIHCALDAVLRLVQNRYWNTVEVVKNYGDIPDIECTAVVNLNEIFLKLVVHAYTRLDGKGRLTLHTSVTDDERILIEINDNGTPLTEEELALLFEPFGTTGDEDARVHGTRLYTARRILTQRGGGLDVTSAVGQGTTLRVLLPAHSPLVREYRDDTATRLPA